MTIAEKREIINTIINLLLQLTAEEEVQEHLCLEFINFNKAGRISMKNIVEKIADFLKNMRADF